MKDFRGREPDAGEEPVGPSAELTERFARIVRADIASSIAADRANGHLALLVDRAMDVSLGVPRIKRRRAPKLRVIALVAAALVLVAASVSAAVVVRARAAAARRAAAEQAANAALAEHERAARARAEANAVEPPAPVVAEAPAAEAHADAVDAAQPPSAKASHASEAATAFAQANEARHGGDYDRAARLYRSLIAHFPKSAEAQASRLILGRLVLDREGDPADALALSNDYLKHAPKGTLAEQALAARANAFKRLGRAADERSAWEALLRSYPDSIHAREARARVAALSGH
jgi:TolA-binding protein